MSSSDPILASLNEAQQAAVTYCEGPSLVIAGAGSGKTRVLTHKIAYLLQHGYQPWSILALTFTNKAAAEMQQRIAALVGGEAAARLWMGTFHSVFARILRREAQHIGYPSSFTIYDSADSRSLIKTIVREMHLDDKVYKPSSVAAAISAAKNRLMLPPAYRASADIARADADAQRPATGQIYERYQQRLLQAGAMDFDDLLLNTYLLFNQHAEVLQRYANGFRYVLVDEYQDTNYAQHAIVWQLTREQRRLCVVGDDAQSIYSFRGADIDNILSFQRTYEGTRLFKLEHNYRSTQRIVAAANSLISHNQGQIHKDVYSTKAEGAKVRISEFLTDIEEANAVVKNIIRHHRDDRMEWNDMAVLYRTNAQSRTLEEALRKHEVPYRIYGGLSFYQRKEVKDMIAYFRLAVNPRDEEALRRVVNYPARGIGDTTLQRLSDAARLHGVSLWQVMQQPEAYDTAVNRGTQAKLAAFVALIDDYARLSGEQDAATLGRHIATTSGIVAALAAHNDPDDVAAREILQELLDGMQQWVDNTPAPSPGLSSEGVPSLASYLNEVSLLSETAESDDEGEKVSLMTIHSAKGLEFRIVYVVGMEEGLFPNQQAMGSRRELEEERRLCYVAITRAEERCYLTCAHTRYRYGRPEFRDPSSFLSEIAPELVERNRPATSHSLSGLTPTGEGSPVGAGRTPRRWQGAAYSAASGARPAEAPLHRGHVPTPLPSGRETWGEVAAASNEPLRVGTVIDHSRFGRGVVTAVTGTGIDAKATIDFDPVGRKQLLLRFAKYTVVKEL